MKRFFFIFFVTLFFVAISHAQEIMQMGHAMLSNVKGDVESLEFYDNASDQSYRICWFSFKYPSVGGDGLPVMLSALACMPDESQNVTEINNVIAGCHITITSNKDCPTEFNRTGNIYSDTYLTMIFAGNATEPQSNLACHNLIIIPDYEGYGITSDRTHPYLCEEVTARQVTDAIRYGIQLYQNDPQVETVRRPFRQDWRTICTGYSQGGAVAMATQRFIEQQGLSEELHLAGSLCGDGPYSPLATILYYLEQDRLGKEMALPVVLPLMLKALCDYDEVMAGHQVSDYLEERFLETGVLDWLSAKEKTSGDIAEAWKQLYKNGKDGDKTYYRSVLTSDGCAYLRNILKPEMLNYLSDLLDDHPDYATAVIPLPEGGTSAEDLHLALEHNNLTRDWEPAYPVCLYHSTGDEVVPFQNYQSASTHLGTQVYFYPSTRNGTHYSTGVEFFMNPVREECIQMLATMNDDGISNPSLIVKYPQEGQMWHDLSGRSLTGCPTTKGIYIHNGKKVVVR